MTVCTPGRNSEHVECQLGLIWKAPMRLSTPAAVMQSTNPLARCVEYLQEDLETMNTEFKFWEEERQRYQVNA